MYVFHSLYRFVVTTAITEEVVGSATVSIFHMCECVALPYEQVYQALPPYHHSCLRDLLRTLQEANGYECGAAVYDPYHVYGK